MGLEDSSLKRPLPTSKEVSGFESCSAKELARWNLQGLFLTEGSLVQFLLISPRFTVRLNLHTALNLFKVCIGQFLHICWLFCGGFVFFILLGLQHSFSIFLGHANCLSPHFFNNVGMRPHQIECFYSLLPVQQLNLLSIAHAV